MADDKGKSSVDAGELDPSKGESGKKTPAPTEVEIEIAGTKVKLSKEAAEAVEKANRAAAASAAAKDSEYQQALAALKAGNQPKKGADQLGGDPNDLENLMFTDPKEYNRRLREEIKAEIRGEQSVANRQTEFWAEFYRQNEDLREHDWLVKAVMQREFETLKPLKTSEAMKELSKATKTAIMGLSKQKGKKGEADPIEGGNQPGVKPSKGTDVSEDSQTGLTGVLQARREARRQAASGKQAAA